MDNITFTCQPAANVNFRIYPDGSCYRENEWEDADIDCNNSDDYDVVSVPYAVVERIEKDVDIQAFLTRRTNNAL